MKIYLYAKSGHTIGLEATKQCATIANIFKEFDPILCTSDFRAGAFAKDNLGIKKYVNIDVMRNLTNIMQRGDILFYSTNEINEQMKKDIEDFCSLSYDINTDIKGVIVDTSIYNKTSTPKIKKTIFFGDDDYNNVFLDMVKESNKYDINLLMGHYFFLGNEKIFSNHFSSIFDEEEYVETIRNTKYLLTASLQTALESISCGNNPILFKRIDKNYDEKYIKEFNIPIIEFKDFNDLVDKFEQTIKNYSKAPDLEIANFGKIFSEVKEKINIFNKLSNP